ncbi:MAG: WG repeat-containing protein [Bacteroidaceae bacterium]|nr:WG repeat-containing protein [Bacteroidaceae bacterium]
MKKSLSILSFVFSFLSMNISAQTYMVKSFVELQNDLTARRNIRTDENGKACALLRINIPTINVSFGKEAVGDIESLPGEYVVYVSELTTALNMDIQSEHMTIDFGKYGINLKSKNCYRLIISGNESTQRRNDYAKVIITANYDNATVLIDGIPVGQTPVELDNVALGTHVISVPNTFGVTMKDRTINIENKIHKINLKLQKEKRNLIKIYVQNSGGGDTGHDAPIWGYNVIQENGKKGIADYTGNIVIPCLYDYFGISVATSYDSNDRSNYEYYCYVYKDKKEGLYQLGVGSIVPCIYDKVEQIHDKGDHIRRDEFFLVQKGNKLGAYTHEGMILNTEFSQISAPYDGIIAAEKEGGYGLYDINGHEIIKPKSVFLINGQHKILPKYKELYYCGDGWFKYVTQSNKEGFVNKFGKEKSIVDLNKEKYYWHVNSNQLFSVRNRETGKWGIMNEQGYWILPVVYESGPTLYDPKYVHGSIILRSKDGCLYMFDKQGFCVAKLQDDISYFDYMDNSNYIVVINNSGKHGIINTNGKTIVPCDYDEKFHGTIDRESGKIVDLSTSYTEEIKWYNDGQNDYFTATNSKGTKIYDNNGNIIISIPLNFRVAHIKEGFIHIYDIETDSYGYMSYDGGILANCIYGMSELAGINEDELNIHYDDSDDDMACIDAEDIMWNCPISEGLAILSLGDCFGFIDNKGEIVVPLIYTAVTPFKHGASFVRKQNGEWMKIYKKDYLK